MPNGSTPTHDDARLALALTRAPGRSGAPSYSESLLRQELLINCAEIQRMVATGFLTSAEYREIQIRSVRMVRIAGLCAIKAEPPALASCPATSDLCMALIRQGGRV